MTTLNTLTARALKAHHEAHQHSLWRMLVQRLQLMEEAQVRFLTSLVRVGLSSSTDPFKNDTPSVQIVFDEAYTVMRASVQIDGVRLVSEGLTCCGDTIRGERPCVSCGAPVVSPPLNRPCAGSFDHASVAAARFLERLGAWLEPQSYCGGTVCENATKATCRHNCTDPEDCTGDCDADAWHKALVDRKES